MLLNSQGNGIQGQNAATVLWPAVLGNDNELSAVVNEQLLFISAFLHIKAEHLSPKIWMAVFSTQMRIHFPCCAKSILWKEGSVGLDSFFFKSYLLSEIRQFSTDGHKSTKYLGSLPVFSPSSYIFVKPPSLLPAALCKPLNSLYRREWICLVSTAMRLEQCMCGFKVSEASTTKGTNNKSEGNNLQWDDFCHIRSLCVKLHVKWITVFVQYRSMIKSGLNY